MEVSRATYPALGFTVVVFEGGSKVTYNHKTNNINYKSSTGASFDEAYNPDGEWFDMMNRFKLWK
jgi:hypothetical protein